MSYNPSTTPCHRVGHPVPPMIPLKPRQNFTTGLDGIFYDDYVPIDEKAIIQEGSTYDLQAANLECNRIGCRMFIRDNIDGKTNFHTRYTPREDCCGLGTNFERAGGCQCESSCPTCTCRGMNTIDPISAWHKANPQPGSQVSGPLGNKMRENFTDPDQKKTLIKCVAFIVILYLLMEGGQTGLLGSADNEFSTLTCSKLVINGQSQGMQCSVSE